MNKVIEMGRLTKDPVVRYTSGEAKAVCSFTLAVNRRGTTEQKADFINFVAWGKNAEFLQKHCIKGMQIAVYGSLQTRKWDDAEGKRHYIMEVVASEIYFADAKRNGSEEKYGDAYEGGSDGYYPLDDDPFPPFA